MEEGMCGEFTYLYEGKNGKEREVYKGVLV